MFTTLGIDQQLIDKSIPSAPLGAAVYNSLLPTNATPLELAIEQVQAGGYDLAIPIRAIRDYQACPVNLLPWLAWDRRVEGWDDLWTESQKREAIHQSISLYRKKGTLWSILQTILNHGFALDSIIFYSNSFPLDGSVMPDGTHLIGGSSAAYIYSIVLNHHNITKKQKHRLYQSIMNTQPAVMLLYRVYSLANNLIPNGDCLLDGTYNLGERLE